MVAIRDLITFTSITKPQPITSTEWDALIATLKGDELVLLAHKYKDKLYAANVRDYLGVKSTSRNINKHIMNTAKDHPKKFWVFNNGITLLTTDFTHRGNKIVCTGIAVINGAQTIGSLASLSYDQNVEEIKILARIIKASDSKLINDIIRFNNTQNPIKAWELRVNDPVQDHIKKQLKERYVRWTPSVGQDRGHIKRESCHSYSVCCHGFYHMG